MSLIENAVILICYQNAKKSAAIENRVSNIVLVVYQKFWIVKVDLTRK